MEDLNPEGLNHIRQSVNGGEPEVMITFEKSAVDHDYDRLPYAERLVMAAPLDKAAPVRPCFRLTFYTGEDAKRYGKWKLTYWGKSLCMNLQENRLNGFLGQYTFFAAIVDDIGGNKDGHFVESWNRSCRALPELAGGFDEILARMVCEYFESKAKG